MIPPSQTQTPAQQTGELVVLRGKANVSALTGWARLSRGSAPHTQRELQGDISITLDDGATLNVECATISSTLIPTNKTRPGFILRNSPLKKLLHELDDIPSWKIETLQGACIQSGDTIEVWGEVSDLTFTQEDKPHREAATRQAKAIKARLIAVDPGARLAIKEAAHEYDQGFIAPTLPMWARYSKLWSVLALFILLDWIVRGYSSAHLFALFSIMLTPSCLGAAGVFHLHYRLHNILRPMWNSLAFGAICGIMFFPMMSVGSSPPEINALIGGIFAAWSLLASLILGVTIGIFNTDKHSTQETGVSREEWHQTKATFWEVLVLVLLQCLLFLLHSSDLAGWQKFIKAE